MKTIMSAIASRRKMARKWNAERGATLVMIAGALAVILTAAALSIDLGALYVQRSEAQRAADAGALAGAQVFATSGCTLNASCLSGTVELAATAQATQVAQQNLVLGQTPTIPAPTFSAGGGSQTDPLITVTATAPAKTFFLPLSAGATISAKATAEAYNPSGSTTGPKICASCLKPFFVPNCDPIHLNVINPNCPTTAGAFFSNGNIVNGNSIVGNSWQLHLQTSGNQQAVPSQWLEVAFDETAPGCSGGQGATAWAKGVTQCPTNQITCGTQLCTLNGFKVGPNNQAVGDLISYGNGKPNGTNATDSVSCSNGVCTMRAGSRNPFAANGQTITQSGSLVSVPVYDGTMQSGGGVVSVVGYMQLFIKDIQHQGQFDNIDVVIVSATTCGNMSGAGSCGSTGGGSGTGGTASGGGATLIPVRLVQNP
jgi:putative Flp pilus-assembly TadE/G-like protein